MPPDPLDDSCFRLIDSWIDQCRMHGKCSLPTSVTLPKRVIAISIDPSESPRLRVTNNELGQYVILSHCWGKRALVALTQSLITQYQEAIQVEELPRSFKDAIEITRKLGFRYLWIDALCIIQDNAEDWAQEVVKMASYYGLSALMISATDAEDSSKGILNVRDASYSPFLGKKRKYCFQQHLFRSDWEIRESILATRGWAAQERMLAPRILHYTKRQIIWEFAVGIIPEASGLYTPNSFQLGYQKSKLQPLVTEALDQTYPASHGFSIANKEPGVDPRVATLDKLRIRHECVREYSSRSLSVPSDRFHAIAGVAKIVNSKGELVTYLTSLWSAYLASSLAWRRLSSRLSTPAIYTAPSWSWASVRGGVGQSVSGVEMNLHMRIDETESFLREPFHLLLIDGQIVLQDERNIYGAVLEGSYITVEGSCATYTEFGRLSKDLFQCHPHNLYWFFESRTNRGGDTSLSYQQERGNVAQDYWLPVKAASLQHITEDLAAYDFCIFLTATEWYDRMGFVSILLLNWVDREAKVAQRAGLAELWFGDFPDREQSIRSFRAFDWQRWTVRLI